MSNDAEVIARAVRGDVDALEALASAHRPTILRTAGHLLGDDDAAEDVTQDVLVRMQRSLPGFQGDAELATWLYRVTLNRCRDYQRARQRRSSDVEISAVAGSPHLSVHPTADKNVDRERARDAVRSAIERLPREQKEAVMLRYMDDISYADISRMTGSPVGTIASRVFRALERLGREVESTHLEVLK